MSKIIRTGEKDDDSSDLEFWRRAGAQARFEAAAEIVREVERMRGRDPDAPMQKSVTRIIAGVNQERNQIEESSS